MIIEIISKNGSQTAAERDPRWTERHEAWYLRGGERGPTRSHPTRPDDGDIDMSRTSHSSASAPSPARALLTPLYAASIWLEARLALRVPSFRLRFPRDLREIESAPERLFSFVREAAGLPEGATLVEVRRRSGMVNEPDKDRTAAGFDVLVRHGDRTTTLPVFVKFQSGRGMPLLLQAVRAAVEPGVAREVDFYQRLAATVPVRTARAYVADAIPAINRTCIVLEHVDGENVADWRGCPLPGIRAMLTAVARMNAAFVGRTASDPRTSWIPARGGLDYASFVATLAGSVPAWYKELWKALDRYFRARPLTLVHGDCRPGNVLFRGACTLTPADGGELTASPWPDAGLAAPEVVFTDWEAVNAAPLLWDFTYCTIVGLRIADRQAHLPRLFDEFVAALEREGVEAALLSPERCRLEVDLLTMVLYYVAALVVSKGFWDNQGNTIDDYRAWTARIVAALRGVDAQRAAVALGVATEVVLRLQREANFPARE
jgi:hypothetical protein